MWTTTTKPNDMSSEDLPLSVLSEKEKKARQYAINAHASVNHLYDGRPYEYHLNLAAREALRIDASESERCAIWLHDTIEDCRKTYNNIKDAFGVEVADIVYAVTNEKGKARAERANEKYYEGIANTPGAIIVKLCDRIANALHSLDSGNERMMLVYLQEYPVFVKHLRYDMPSRKAATLWHRLDEVMAECAIALHATERK